MRGTLLESALSFSIHHDDLLTVCEWRCFPSPAVQLVPL